MTAGFAFGDQEWPGVAKVIEEMGELGQVLGRIMAVHGAPAFLDVPPTDLRAQFVRELADLRAAIDFCSGELTRDERGLFAERRTTKLQLFQKWHREQRWPGAPDAGA